MLPMKLAASPLTRSGGVLIFNALQSSPPKRSVAPGRPIVRGYLEGLELESGRNGAADQRPLTESLRGLPRVRRHYGLRPLAGGEIGSQREAFDRAVGVERDLERERRAGVIVPDLDRIDLVPMRALAAREQVIGRGRCRARAVHHTRVAERLAKMSALGMGLEIEQAHDFGGGEHCGSSSGV